jgi:hypothetical protein
MENMSVPQGRLVFLGIRTANSTADGPLPGFFLGATERWWVQEGLIPRLREDLQGTQLTVEANLYAPLANEFDYNDALIVVIDAGAETLAFAMTTLAQILAEYQTHWEGVVIGQL